MKITINTTNEDKVEIIREALKELHLEVDVLKDNADFTVSVEEYKKNYEEGEHLITEGTLTDKDGDKFIGNGTEIHLYEKTLEEIDKDQLVKEAVQRAYTKYLIDKTDLKSSFRPKSSAVVIDDEENFLLVQLPSYNETDWNFCGGGIEEGEDEKQAILRELEEELGTSEFKVVKKSDYKKQYDWPIWMVAGDIEKGKTNIYRGQEEAYFLVKFTGNKDEIKIKPDELRAAKWIKYEQLKDHLNFDRHENIVEDVIDSLIKEL